jgi:modulator of FtsH protease HflK
MKFLYMVFLWHGTVQYRIKDAYNFLFEVRDPQGMLRDLSEATMRLVVGDRSINEVITKREEKLIYQAREEYNKRIPQARGEAEKTVREAEGYALDRVNRAQGDAIRFTALYEEYAKAEDVTRRRLYLEAIREILPKMGDKYIVDHEQENLLPLLNLGASNEGKPLKGED